MPWCVVRLRDWSFSPHQSAAQMSYVLTSSWLAKSTLDVATWFLVFVGATCKRKARMYRLADLHRTHRCDFERIALWSNHCASFIKTRLIRPCLM